MESYMHNSGTIIGMGGTEIFFQIWGVSSPKGILVIAHGVGEHSGRYNNIINELAGKNISVYAIDHRGHGKSGGKRGHVDSFMDYVYDLKLFIDFISEENSGIPIVLLGHSMGGIIAFKYALTYSDDLSGLILSSAALRTSVEVPSWKTGLANIFSKYLPSFTMSSGLDAKDLSHDEHVVDAYENDPLVHDKVSAKWYTEFTKTAEECMNRALEIRMPLLVFHGSDDKIIDYRASETVFQNSSSLVKEIHIYDGFYHEAMNDTDKKQVLQAVAKWIVKIVGMRKISAKKTAVKSKVKKAAKKTSKAKPKKAVKKKAKKAIKKSVKKTARKKAASSVKKKPAKAVKKASKKKAAVKKAPAKKTKKTGARGKKKTATRTKKRSKKK